MSKLLREIDVWKVFKSNFRYLRCKITLVNQDEFVLGNPKCQSIELSIKKNKIKEDLLKEMSIKQSTSRKWELPTNWILKSIGRKSLYEERQTNKQHEKTG